MGNVMTDILRVVEKYKIFRNKGSGGAQRLGM